MSNNDIPRSKNIILVRNSLEITMKVVRTAESANIMQTIMTVFGLYGKEGVVLIEDESNCVLLGDLLVLFWANHNISPKYRVAICGEPGIVTERGGIFSI